MRKGEKKRGRPASYEPREKMTFRTAVRLDAEAYAALVKLEDAARAAGVRSPRSVAIRRAFIEAAERLEAAPQKATSTGIAKSGENGLTTSNDSR